MATYSFASTIWRVQGEAAWHFLDVPEDVTDEIDERYGSGSPAAAGRRGFGSVRVEVSLGTTTWRTSLFPDSKRGCYVLPVKKAVRTANRLSEGSPVHVNLRVVD